MVSTIFDETLKAEAVTIVARYDVVGIVHEAICHLAAINDQEQDKVIEEFFMRISTNNITVEDNLHAVEKKEDIEQEALIEESHMKYVFNIVFKYVGVQNSTGAEVESKVVNKFHADLKLIEEWIHK